jgi:hypothetical protein
MNEFGSVLTELVLSLRASFLYTLIIKTQLLKRLQRVIVVDSATYSLKDGVEDNGGFLKGGA